MIVRLSTKFTPLTGSFVSNILLHAALHVPYLLVGPGQSGKTTAVVECVKQILYSEPESRVLVAVHRSLCLSFYLTH